MPDIPKEKPYERLITKNVRKQLIRKALRASPAAELQYTASLKRILGGIHEWTMDALAPILAKWEPEVRHDASAKRTGVSQVTSRVVAGLKVHVAQHVGDAFDRMSATVNKTNAAGMKVIGINPLWTTPIHQIPQTLNVIREAREANIQYMVDAGQAYAEDVRGVLEDPDNFGLHTDALKTLLQERADVSASRAETIARTSTTQLNAALTQHRQTSAGINRYTWSTSRDERVRGDPDGRYPDADPSHYALEGTVHSWDDPPPADVDGSPAHPGEAINCFPEDSEIQFAHGVRKGFRRWYDGELTEIITHSGKTIRATPNHPMLTTRGWVAIGALKLSDYLLEISDESLYASKHDEFYRVTSIGEVFAALKVFGISSPSGKASRADFHGDGTESKVDVVLPAGPLTLNIFADGPKSSDEFTLSLTDPSWFGKRSFDEFLLGTGLTTNRSVSRAGQSRTLLRAKTTHSEDISFTSATNRDPCLSKSRLQSNTGDSYAIRDRQQTLSALVGGDDRDHVHVEPVVSGFSFSPVRLHADSPEFLAQVVGVNVEDTGDLLQGLPCIQKFTRVRSIDRLSFSGHVFNLQTQEGWYTANGLVVHNCRCVAIPLIEEPGPEDE